MSRRASPTFESVKARYETEEANLKRVFERARQLRPCVLVLEDLDALINPENRSFFLNQLDGFEKNVGMIVLATTNHPEKIAEQTAGFSFSNCQASASN
ncbi:MAG: AAA family ATPase [Polyangiaceae bacterium]